jgi:biotin carboxyl carrier protein
MSPTDFLTDSSPSRVVVQPTTSDPTTSQGDNPAIYWDRLRQHLVKVVTGNQHKPRMLAAVAQVVVEQCGVTGVAYYERDEAQTLVTSTALGQLAESNDSTKKTLFTLAEASCSASRLVMESIPGGSVAACVPVTIPGCQAEVMVALLSKGQGSNDLWFGALEVAAAYITLWHTQRNSARAEHEAQQTAAMQELLEEAETCDDLAQACRVLVDRMREYVDCDRVALATCPRQGGRSVLRAVSGAVKFDSHSPLVTAVESALDEAIVREELTVWPPESPAGRQAALAHHKLCTISDVSCVISCPLRNAKGELVGAWAFMGSRQSLARPHVVRLLRASETRVASSLHLMSRVRTSLGKKLFTAVFGKQGSWKARAFVLGLCCAVAALLLPVNYKVHCDCQLEPVTRRFVASPYDGILDRALVTVGATVEPGDVLARMDGREIRWELAGIIAERDRATKQSEASFANHEFGAANVARLEVERLDLKKQLYESRQKNLEITSPIQGIVVAGDLEKAEGAPVACGQTLFEIAPLSEMIAELAIPEADISHVHEGQEVVLHLEASSQGPLRATVTRVRPRAEIREQQNVFIAEVQLVNADGSLRPGMQGAARVVGPRRTLAWNLFHKPWQSLSLWLGW